MRDRVECSREYYVQVLANEMPTDVSPVSGPSLK